MPPCLTLVDTGRAKCPASNPGETRSTSCWSTHSTAPPSKAPMRCWTFCARGSTSWRWPGCPCSPLTTCPNRRRGCARHWASSGPKSTCLCCSWRTHQIQGPLFFNVASINQSIHQSINPSTSQEPKEEEDKRNKKRNFNRSINQWTNQSSNQSMNPSDKKQET